MYNRICVNMDEGGDDRSFSGDEDDEVNNNKVRRKGWISQVYDSEERYDNSDCSKGRSKLCWCEEFNFVYLLICEWFVCDDDPSGNVFCYARFRDRGLVTDLLKFANANSCSYLCLNSKNGCSEIKILFLSHLIHEWSMTTMEALHSK